MATLKELREQRATIATQAQTKFDEIKDDTKEDRAAEIEREFDAMMTDHDKIGETIRRMERLEKAQSDERTRLESVDKTKRPDTATEGRAADADVVTYEKAFRAYIASHGNEGLMEPEARSVLQAGHVNLESRAQTTTTTAGGYTVPTEMASFIVKSMAAWGPMYDPGVTSEIVTSGGGQITIPTVDDTARVIVKSTEGTTYTDDGGSDVTFGQKTLDAYPFNTEWLRVSKELADDSAFNIEQFIGGLLGEGLGRRANTELTTGDGTGDPNGVVTASALGKTAAGVAAITGDEIIDLLHSVGPAYRASPNVAFMFNDLTLAAIRKLKDGNGNYLWQMGNVQNGEPANLLGYRFHVNQAMASLATGNKTVLFGDFGKYYVRKVGAPMIGAISDKDFWPGFGIAGYIRFDGELADTAAIKHMIQA